MDRIGLPCSPSSSDDEMLDRTFYVVLVVAVVSVDRVALLSKKFNGREVSSRRISVVPRVPVGCNRNRPDE